jgi:hypothetical protein
LSGHTGDTVPANAVVAVRDEVLGHVRDHFLGLASSIAPALVRVETEAEVERIFHFPGRDCGIATRQTVNFGKLDRQCLPQLRPADVRRGIWGRAYRGLGMSPPNAFPARPRRHAARFVM